MRVYVVVEPYDSFVYYAGNDIELANAAAHRSHIRTIHVWENNAELDDIILD